PAAAGPGGAPCVRGCASLVGSGAKCEYEVPSPLPPPPETAPEIADVGVAVVQWWCGGPGRLTDAVVRPVRLVMGRPEGREEAMEAVTVGGAEEGCGVVGPEPPGTEMVGPEEAGPMAEETRVPLQQSVEKGV
ncbi:MAG: hypothetical protein LQ340_001640, partial [Diploschistes diacapsis]